MLRLLLAMAVFLPLGASAAPLPAVETFTGQEPSALAAADAFAADVCVRAIASCAEAKALGSAYKSALTDATACDKAGCTLEVIKSQAAAIGELDKREASLPAEGRTSRAFLALSIIATGRLTSAATRLGSPYAASTHAGEGLPAANKALAGYCLISPTNCAAMSSLLAETSSLGGKIKECSSSKCALEAADPLVERAQGAFSPFFALDRLAKTDTLEIFVIINGVYNDGIALYSPLADGAVADLVAGADKLKRNLDLAEKNASVPIGAVDSAGPALLESHRRAALAADRLSYYLGYTEKNGAEGRRATVNAAAIKLSGLRARALALRTARGLGEDKAGPGAVEARGAANPVRASFSSPGPLTAAPERTFLDRRLVPSPKGGPKEDAPPILPESGGYFKLLGRAASSDPTVRADALRRLKLTKTVGDPGRYAPQAFTQEGNDSCAVAAQVAVLRAQGLLPTTVDPKVQERELVDEAKRLGYMKAGTPPNYTASLLIERGMLVDKHAHGKWSELESALRRGGLIQASVDARKLWKIAAPNPLGHSILITGAEVGKGGREILGVYINDTGTEPAGAGKFIPIGQFKEAWFGSFAEIR
jgi:hypothetical protein